MSNKKKAQGGLSAREARLEDEAEVYAFLQQRAKEEAARIENAVRKKSTTAMAKDFIFLEQFKQYASALFKDKLTPPKYATKKHTKPIEREVNLLISDTHFQSLLDPNELPVAYGSVEEARSFAAVMVQAGEFKEQYRENTALNVHILGDIIEGKLHDPQNAAPLAKQCTAALSILRQGIYYLSSKFPRVTVRCTPGNHGRWKDRHRDRATHEKVDALETVIYFGVKEACLGLPNVQVEIPYTPYITYDSFGQRAFGTHGDTVINPGNPGKSINVENIRRQTNEWNSKLSHEDRFQLFFVGHVHFATNLILPNGVRFISNGALVPTDGFGLSLGYPNTTRGQWIWESVPGHVVGDSRFIVVDEAIHKDRTLDTIIKPFERF